MTVVFVSASPGVWGAEQSMLTLAGSLHGLGFDVLLVCCCDELVDAWSGEVGSQVVKVTVKGSSRVSQNFALWRAALRLSRPSAFVVFSYQLALGVPLVRILRPRSRAIFDLHIVFAGWRGRTVAWILSTWFHQIVAVSASVAAQVRRPAKVRVLYRPIASTGRVLGDGTQTNTVGVVGRVSPEKQIEVAVAAMESVDPVARLVVRGMVTPENREYAVYVENLGSRLLRDRFVLQGPVEARYALDGLDVLVVCNPAEPMGRTVPEAQLSGVVAVVPDTGGSAELVKDGETGFQYHAGSAEGLASAIERARVASRSGCIREQAFRVARERHDPDAYAVRYAQMIC